jgi:hypothetical protein
LRNHKKIISRGLFFIGGAAINSLIQFPAAFSRREKELFGLAEKKCFLAF